MSEDLLETAPSPCRAQPLKEYVTMPAALDPTWEEP